MKNHEYFIRAKVFAFLPKLSVQVNGKCLKFNRSLSRKTKRSTCRMWSVIAGKRGAPSSAIGQFNQVDNRRARSHRNFHVNPPYPTGPHRKIQKILSFEPLEVNGEQSWVLATSLHLLWLILLRVLAEFWGKSWGTRQENKKNPLKFSRKLSNWAEF